jgi:MFS family permease
MVTRATESAGWRVVIAAYFGVMVSFGSLLVFTFSIFLKPLSASFGWSRESISGAFGLAAITVAICSPVLGILLDRLGPRKVILPCMTVYALAFGSLGLLSGSLTQLYVTFAVLGVVGNGTTQMGYSRAVSTWFDKRRGLALALVMAGVGTGAMIFPPLAQWLITHYGWSQTYFLLAAVVLLLGIPLTAMFVRESPRREEHSEGRELPGVTVLAGILSSSFWIIVAMLFLSSVAINGAITHLAALLTDRGVSGGTAALAASVMGLTSFLGRLLTGFLLDRFFGPRVGFVLIAVAAGGILLLANAQSAATGMAAAALIGLGLGGEADVTPYLLTRYFGLRSFSTLYGFTWTAYAVAGAVGPIIMGMAFDGTGSYRSLLILLSAVTLVAACILLALPRYSLPAAAGR